MEEVCMDYRKLSELEDMIENEMFYGIPISEFNSEMLDYMDTQELREFYTVLNMLHLKEIDKIVDKKYMLT
jgi:hypothetical protein